MLIIRKITRRKNSLNRKLHSPFEAANLCKLMIIKEFDYLHTQSLKTCERYALGANTTQKFVLIAFNKLNFARVDKTQKPQ